MIVFAGIACHNPLLLRDKKLTHSDTATGLTELTKAIAAAHLDALVVISEHARAFNKKYTLQFATEFHPALKQFGIIASHAAYKSHVPLAGIIQTYARQHALPLQQVANADLDYGSATALKLLNFTKSPPPPLVVLGTADRSIVDHSDIGYHLKDVLHNAPERIGILITGDGSHRHTSDSPAGFSAQAADFDNALLTTLETRSVAGLTRMTQQFPDVDECLSKPLALGFGMLRRFPTNTKILSYETRHGLGVLSAILFAD